MYAMLGNFTFEMAAAFSEFEDSVGVDYAEHALIGTKPVLQRMGDKLQEIKLALVFHAAYCDPDREIERLRSVIFSKDAMALSLGTGEFKGYFVATELDSVVRHADSDGLILHAEARLTLREFVQDQNSKSAALAVVGTNLPKVGGLPAGTASPLQRVMGAARKAVVAMNTASRVVALANQFSADPLRALSSVPGCLSSVQKAAGAMGFSQTALQSLSSFAAAAPAAASMANAGLSLQRAYAALNGLNAGNVSFGLSGAAAQIDQAKRTINSIEPQLSKLAARAIVRS